MLHAYNFKIFEQLLKIKLNAVNISDFISKLSDFNFTNHIGAFRLRTIE